MKYLLDKDHASEIYTHHVYTHAEDVNVHMKKQQLTHARSVYFTFE